VEPQPPLETPHRRWSVWPPRHRLIAELVALLAIAALVGGVFGYDRFRDAHNTRLAHRDAQVLQGRIAKALSEQQASDDQPWCQGPRDTYRRCWVTKGQPADVTVGLYNALQGAGDGFPLELTPASPRADDLFCWKAGRVAPTAQTCLLTVRLGRVMANVSVEDERLLSRDKGWLTSTEPPTQSTVQFSIFSAYLDQSSG
jgi:hypothetical protein